MKTIEPDRDLTTQKRDFHNITLVGFMGTGKTTVGRLLEQRLGFKFIDTDQIIEESIGKTIAQIFESEGEPTFRSYEMQVVQQLNEKRKTIIATGGGLVLNVSNLHSLKKHSLVVCLWASPRKIWERVHNQIHRPLLEKPGAKEKVKQIARIEELLEIRKSVYREADLLVDTDNRDVQKVAATIIIQFNAKRTASERYRPYRP